MKSKLFLLTFILATSISSVFAAPPYEPPRRDIYPVQKPLLGPCGTTPCNLQPMVQPRLDIKLDDIKLDTKIEQDNTKDIEYKLPPKFEYQK